MMLHIEYSRAATSSIKAQLSVSLSSAEEATSAVTLPLKWHSHSLYDCNLLASVAKTLASNGI